MKILKYKIIILSQYEEELHKILHIKEENFRALIQNLNKNLNYFKQFVKDFNHLLDLLK